MTYVLYLSLRRARRHLRHRNLDNQRLKEENENLRHDKADDLRADEHRQVRRLVSRGNQEEIHERDHDGRHERRVDQIGNNRFHDVRLESPGLQMEFAAQSCIYLGHRYNETDGETDNEAEDEPFQEADDNCDHGHFRRMLGGQVSCERKRKTHHERHHE